MPPAQLTDEQVAAPVSYPCPDCGQLTDSLKQYRFVKWFVIFLAVAIWKPDVHVACPPCMRTYVWRRGLLIILVNFLLSILWITAVKGDRTPLNIFLANLILVFAFLPWLVGVTVATTRKGHSKSILAPQPQATVAPEATAQPKASWVSTLLFWVVLLGIVFGFVYWLTTLR